MMMHAGITPDAPRYTPAMVNAWRGFTGRVQRVFRLIVLFCVLRFVVGLVVLLLFNRDAIAWGPELSVLVVAIVAVYVGVALIVRRWSPPFANRR
jgi:hypothetical protein